MPVNNDVLRDALDRTAASHGPGLFGLVTEHGDAVFTGSAGVADLADSRPIRPRDRFRVASVTKVYVATVILQLVDERALSLADSIDHWLPGLVPDGHAITVEMLLRLRSGLPDYVPRVLGDPPDLGVLDRYWAPKQLIEAALTDADRWAPDTGFRYSNTDFILLGLIIERATGQRVDAQLWQRIFHPLHLDDTEFPTVDPHVRGQHAPGHLRVGPTAPYAECTTLSPSESWTAGAIISTAPDVAAFLDALLDGRLLRPDTLVGMLDTTEIVDEYRSRGLGIVRYQFDEGPPAWGHTGGTPGYSTVAMRTAGGRAIVLWQNGVEEDGPMGSDTPFIRAALAM